jgi:phosphoribosylglycinamide formyltransferase 1
VISATPRVHRLGVLLSGRGSNFLAIAEAIAQRRLANASIAVVISNRSDSPGIAAARSARFATEVIEPQGRKRAEHDAEIIASLKAHQVDLVCLAGYMRLLSAEFVRAFPQRILNIHPSLLPAFPGLEAQRQALEYGVTVSGCTVHFVDEELDHGVIVLQKTVPVFADDDEHTLAARILVQEHVAYAEAIDRVISGRYRFAGRRYVAAQTENE